MIDQFSNTIDNVLKHRKDVANLEWQHQEDERKRKEDLIKKKKKAHKHQHKKEEDKNEVEMAFENSDGVDDTLKKDDSLYQGSSV